MKKRTIAYIDGFNLYYGLLRREPAYKWLDLWKLAEALVSPLNQIVAVKYFTSRVNYDPKKPLSKEHQEIYLRALQKIGTVEIIEGYYQRQDAKMPFRFEPCKSCRPYAVCQMRLSMARTIVSFVAPMRGGDATAREGARGWGRARGAGDWGGEENFLGHAWVWNLWYNLTQKIGNELWRGL